MTRKAVGERERLANALRPVVHSAFVVLKDMAGGAVWTVDCDKLAEAIMPLLRRRQRGTRVRYPKPRPYAPCYAHQNGTVVGCAECWAHDSDRVWNACLEEVARLNAPRGRKGKS